MEKTLKSALVIIMLFGLVLTSCKKKKTESETKETDETPVFTEHSSDVLISNNNVDLSLDDAENALNYSSLAGFKGAGTMDYPICGAIVDSSDLLSSKTITITYNGNTCNGLRNRTGAIVIKLVNGTRWRDQGAVMSITYINFKVTLLSTNKSNTINGTHYITNVTGGLVPRIDILPNPALITRKIRSFNMNVTFDDGSVRKWMVARSKTWTGSGGQINSYSVSGDTTLNGVSNTELWGTNRAGKSFTTSIDVPILVTIPCTGPVSGKKTHNVNGRLLTIVYGTDANGNAAPSSTCPNHYLLTWTSLTNVTKTHIGTY